MIHAVVFKLEYVLFILWLYFELTPQQFFDENTQNPELIQKAISGMKQLNEDDLLMLLGFINRLLKTEWKMNRSKGEDALIYTFASSSFL